MPGVDGKKAPTTKRAGGGEGICMGMRRKMVEVRDVDAGHLITRPRERTESETVHAKTAPIAMNDMERRRRAEEMSAGTAMENMTERTGEIDVGGLGRRGRPRGREV